MLCWVITLPDYERMRVDDMRSLLRDAWIRDNDGQRAHRRGVGPGVSKAKKSVLVERCRAMMIGGTVQVPQPNAKLRL